MVLRIILRCLEVICCPKGLGSVPDDQKVVGLKPMAGGLYLLEHGPAGRFALT